MADIQTFLYSAQDLRGGGRSGGSQFQFILLDPDLAGAAAVDRRGWKTALRMSATASRT